MGLSWFFPHCHPDGVYNIIIQMPMILIENQERREWGRGDGEQGEGGERDSFNLHVTGLQEVRLVFFLFQLSLMHRHWRLLLAYFMHAI